MTKEKLDVIGRELLFDGFNRLTRLIFKYRRHNGDWSEEIEREVFERGLAAAVLPYDPERDAVVLIEQFRPGAYLMGEDAWQLEPVAGLCDDGEDPETTVKREAIEEAGCELGELVHVCDYLVSPGCVDEKVVVYCGRVDAGSVAETAGKPEEDEETKIYVIDFETCMQQLKNGEFGYALTIISLQWLALNRAELRKSWGYGTD